MWSRRFRRPSIALAEAAGALIAPRRTHAVPRTIFWVRLSLKFLSKSLILLVGAPGFEPGTPSPPDWCANRAALRSDRHRHYKFEWDQPQQVQNCKDFAIVPYSSALKFMRSPKGGQISCSRSSHALLSSPSLCGQTGNRTKRWSEGRLCSMTIWFVRASFSLGET